MTGEGNPTLRDAEIDHMIELLAGYWARNPYLRLGQMIDNFTRVANRPLWQFDLADLEYVLRELDDRETRAASLHDLIVLPPEEDG